MKRGHVKVNLILRVFFYTFNLIIPKFKFKTCIVAYPDLDDMTRGLVPHIIKTDNCYILTSSNYTGKRPVWLPGNVNVVRKTSILGLWHLLTCSKIYFTHGIFSFFKKISRNRQSVINVWHGMPLKSIGLLDGKKSVPDCHTVYSTSEFFAPIMAKALGCEDVRVCGLPRNDLLSMGNDLSQTSYKKKIKYSIIWLPTYRVSKVGDVRIDGSNSSLLPFDDLDITYINDVLKELNAVLYIKPHPMALTMSKPMLKDDINNLKIINDEWLEQEGFTLYEMLSQSDMLWTDFSSVFIDYLITNKPVKFIISDFEEYKNNRGFTYSLNEHPLPGQVITSKKEFYAMLKNIDFLPSSEIDLEKYHSTKEYIHQG